MSAKTKVYFATAVALWDADFYVKVDDDVHVNIGKKMHKQALSFVLALLNLQVRRISSKFYKHKRNDHL